MSPCFSTSIVNNNQTEHLEHRKGYLNSGDCVSCEWKFSLLKCSVTQSSVEFHIKKRSLQAEVRHSSFEISAFIVSINVVA